METATRLLHRLTSYEPGREWDQPIEDERVLQNLEVNDIGRLPWFYKRYPGDLPRVDLPRELPSTKQSAVAVLSGRADTVRRELNLLHLARLLFLSAGVVRKAERPYGTFLFRASGSAGGRFPLELYVAVPEGTHLPAGVHWYDPLDHALIRVASAPDGDAPALIVTGIPWRTGWRYRERGYRHIYWDAGTSLAQLLACADSAGIPAQLHTHFADGQIAELVGADRVHEFPVALAAFDDGTPALEPGGPAAPGQVDVAPIEFPLVTSAQRAGERESLGSSWPVGGPVEVALEETEPVEAVVLARGSQRRMDPTRGVSKDLLITCMQAALRGIDVPHFVVAHEVEGVEPGLYRWPDLSRPLRTGNLREELYRVCLDQGLARDAAFVVIAATQVGRLDDHGYRDAQLAAGLVEGRLHLLAYALGASGSGMTFMDSEIATLLDAPLDALLFTCVGVPEYTSAAGGQPGAPTEVRPVTPRL